ncbi:MAG: nucleoside phosphorylase [Altibacter sp.]|nr:nucleoside phosphorylase [Altibacter sp.]
MRIPESELILDPEGRIYHLRLLPGEIADTIITVGDPDRVAMVSNYFDHIEVKAAHREFITHTGTYKGKRISVISSGIGVDNIDIVLNELDALVNIDFTTRSIKKDLSSLTIIRIGTSGSIQATIPVDSFLMSHSAIGLDNLLHFYATEDILNRTLSEAFIKHTQWNKINATPYVVAADEALLRLFSSEKMHEGLTGTNVGFYGPQGRVLRLALQDETLQDKIASFSYKGIRLTNFEMETAAIYGLAKLLGHRAVSLNAIIANRAQGTFSKDSMATVDGLIQYTLDHLVG